MIDSIPELKGQLPAYGSKDAQTLMTEAPFSEYFSLYQFALLDGYFQQYRAGSLAINGYSIATHHWRCANAKGTVLLVHGLFDHVGLYVPIIQHLLKQQLDVIAIDLPEHGLSSGVYGEIANFSQYARIIKGVINAIDGQYVLPLSGMGQSTGSAVLMAYSAESPHSCALDKLLLLAPLVYSASTRQIQLAYVLLSPFLNRVKRQFTNNSHDTDFCQFLQHTDPLQPRYISVNWVGAMLRWSKGFSAIDTQSIPVHIIQGDGDKTVDFEQNLPLIKQVFSTCSITIINDAKHHLVRESGQWKEKIYAEVSRFFDTEPSTH